MNSGKILLGLLAGVATGAMLGILFAPDKGSATRKKITKKGEDFAQGISDRFSDFIHEVSEKFESIQHEAKAMVENGKAKMEPAESEVAKLARKSGLQ